MPSPLQVQQAGKVNPFPADPAPRVAGPGRDSAEAAALGAWAGQYGGDLGEMARQWCDDVPALWIKLLFQRKVVGSEESRSPLGWVQYLGKILGSWYERGACEYLAGPAPVGGGGRPEPETVYLTVDPTAETVSPARVAQLRAMFRDLNGPRPAPVASSRRGSASRA